MISVAIDGPSGAGKSSLAKRLAKDLGYVYVDTGAMYRSIGLYAVRAGVDPKDEAAVTALLPQIKLAIRLVDGAQHIYLNGEDVSDAIRAENIGMAASAVSAHPPVRAFLLDTQRGLAADPIDAAACAQALAQKLGTVVVLSGAEDLVTDGTALHTVSGGSDLMRRVTGAGCMLTVLCGAFAAVQPQAPLQAAVQAAEFWKACAAAAEPQAHGPASFRVALLDAAAQIV